MTHFIPMWMKYHETHVREMDKGNMSKKTLVLAVKIIVAGRFALTLAE